MHEMAGSGGMEILNKQAFSELELSLPSFELQKHFGTLLSSFERKIEIADKLLQQLYACKNSLLRKMFI